MTGNCQARFCRRALGVTLALSLTLIEWKAPSGSSDTDQFLYDNEGNRVLQQATSSGAVSDTISFDGYTDVTIASGTTSTTKYYSVGGQKVAMNKDGAFSYLLPDLLGSSSIALSSTGMVEAVQLYSPFGSTLYSDGLMPSPFNFTGQRLDSLTGLLYYGARYYDPVSGRFISADTVENNASGDDPYAYVKGNPETMTDPTGHWGWVVAALTVLAVSIALIAFAPIIAPLLLTAATAIGISTSVGAITAALVATGIGGVIGWGSGLATHLIVDSIDNIKPTWDGMGKAAAIGGIAGWFSPATSWLNGVKAGFYGALSNSLNAIPGGQEHEPIQAPIKVSKAKSKKQQLIAKRPSSHHSNPLVETYSPMPTYNAPTSNYMNQDPVYSNSWNGYDYSGNVYGYSDSIYSFASGSQSYNEELYSASNGYVTLSNGRSRLS